MNSLVQHIVFSFLLFGTGFITGLKACTHNTQAIGSTVTVEHYQQEVSSQPEIKVNKTQKLVSVSQTVNTERYGKITTSQKLLSNTLVSLTLTTHIVLPNLSSLIIQKRIFEGYFFPATPS